MPERDTQQPLWQPNPERVAASNLAAFMRAAEPIAGRRFSSYAELHAWSVEHRPAFWDLIWDHCGVIGDKGPRILIDDAMPGARFFPDARLNFAENLLRRNDATTALVFRGEDKLERRLSWAELNALVSRLQQALAAAGVGVGDRVAAMLPNLPEAIAVMLATASLGAVFSSCSPDFGERGVLDRFGQIEPKVLVSCDGYWYAGKRILIADKLAAVTAKLPTVEKVVIVPYLGDAGTIAASLPNGVALAKFLGPFQAKPVTYVRLPFATPLYILYSSGTTGVPKCIVHGAGGTLLQHLKEHRLHCGVKPDDRVFYFTTLGWMMWNWLASALASEATVILFDGSPFAPTQTVLFDYAQFERVTVFGTSAKYIDACKKAGLEPARTHNLSALELITSTGSPLAPDCFDWVYRAIKSDVHLASISGGTDIVSCFVLGDPTSPVWRSEIQAPGLGMAVDVLGESGTPIRQERGELVCTKAFPSMPVKFWNDPDGAKYRAAYFERFPGVWCHGDFAEWTEHGGMIIHGRSDATLNPGGVRIGTAEIYAQVEQIPEVIEAIAIGQDWEHDVRVVLFVRLKDGVELDDALTKRIKDRIRAGASPRHVPAKILPVADIPRTRSGKITELAVRDIVHGRPVKNTEALANPEALSLFEGLGELTT
ncbi:acetoacetate--CoA ligase [Blastochloris viridis]|uniref:Acetoacetyl-CoA synthetase n=1 Tax=Blastochloris viridis TaxID=1079 RepID=A0A0H5BAM0_BLAVI|nr:acetoacetate--CoA ligase [Blastochloris viridis]ALK10806.1 Acetyl-coenzyme A synthetase [Blastochloris viridis]BAR99225.1 acetoacetyl-CoA synthetase [Blastochloris viridis]CUU43468.1 Acetyl-coenzyme A synthetase [Blastochloris viridis]